MKLKTFILIGAILVALVALEGITSASTGVKSVQSYFSYLDVNVNSTYLPFTGGQTGNNAVPFATLAVGNASQPNDFWDRFLPDIYFNSTGIIIQRFQSISTNMSVRVNVVEFNSSVRVQNGTFNLSGNNKSVVTSIPIAVNTSATALIFYYNSTDETDDYVSNSIMGNISNSSFLNFSMDKNVTTGVKAGHWYVFESLDGSFRVQNVYVALSNASITSSGTIPNSVQMNKTFLIASYFTDEDSDDPRDGSFNLNLTSTTAILASRGGGLPTVPGNVNATVFVITFTGDENVTRAQLNYTAGPAGPNSQVAIITSVNTTTAMAWNPILTGRMDDGSSASAIESSIQYFNITNSTAVTGYRGNTVSSARGSFEVIEWAQLVAASNCWTYDSVGKMLIIPTGCVFNLNIGSIQRI